jgi:hypothetical protein
LPQLHRHLRGDGVHVVRRGDHHGVDPLLALEQAAEVVIARGARVRLLQPHVLGVGRAVAAGHAARHGPVGEGEVDVGDGDDALAPGDERGGVGRPHAAGTDDRHVELTARRDVPRPAEHGARHEGGPPRRGWPHGRRTRGATGRAPAGVRVVSLIVAGVAGA